MTEASEPRRVERDARLRWVPIPKMRVSSPVAQRELKQARVDKLVANFELEQMGNPTVNERDGWFWIIDGQHRVEALRALGFADDVLQCWTYVGLSEEQEAEKFLKINDYLALTVFDRFTKGVTSGDDAACEISRVVLANDCVVSKDKVPGGIRCVGTLLRIHSRAGSVVLGRTLRIIRDAYGDAGFRQSAVVDGIGHLCGRYDGQLDEVKAVAQLSNAHGGFNGLLAQAEILHRKTGGQKGQCVAAAAVEIINRGKGGKKLPGWWKS